MSLRCFQVQILLKNSVKVSKVGAVSSEARLLAAGVNKAVQGKCSSGSFLPVLVFPPCFGLSSLFWSFLFLFFSFYYYIYFFIIPTSQSPSFLCLCNCVLQSVYLDWLLSQFSVSVSRMKTRWTSSSHCYLPADSGKPPCSPPSLA